MGELILYAQQTFNEYILEYTIFIMQHSDKNSP
jgi:hypothetical protein